MSERPLAHLPLTAVESEWVANLPEYLREVANLARGILPRAIEDIERARQAERMLQREREQWARLLRAARFPDGEKHDPMGVEVEMAELSLRDLGVDLCAMVDEKVPR